MWTLIAKYAVQLALWALHNPQAVEAGVADAHALVDAVHAAKQGK